MQKTVIVVPCFNESQRFFPGEFKKAVTEYPWLHFLFVNDGSTDNTSEVLEYLCYSFSPQLEKIQLERNSGKAEAVRQGFLVAFRMDAAYIGYWDADLATPLDVIPRFCEILEASGRKMVIGARVRLLGRKIERRRLRHYLGRIFGTCASMLIKLPVYDTQCGAKIFKNSAEPRKVFSTPFTVRWTFDVEILARFLVGERTSGGTPLIDSAVEYPLEHWKDIAGSKIRAVDFLVALLELGRIFVFMRFQKKAESASNS
jgi:glycosyltransferase involved in cell wall biosynthesis